MHFMWSNVEFGNRLVKNHRGQGKPQPYKRVKFQLTTKPFPFLDHFNHDNYTFTVHTVYITYHGWCAKCPKAPAPAAAAAYAAGGYPAIPHVDGDEYNDGFIVPGDGRDVLGVCPRPGHCLKDQIRQI